MLLYTTLLGVLVSVSSSSFNESLSNTATDRTSPSVVDDFVSTFPTAYGHISAG